VPRAGPGLSHYLRGALGWPPRCRVFLEVPRAGSGLSHYLRGALGWPQAVAFFLEVPRASPGRSKPKKQIQHVAIFRAVLTHSRKLQTYIAVCCSMLQYIAAWCSIRKRHYNIRAGCCILRQIATVYLHSAADCEFRELPRATASYRQLSPFLPTPQQPAPPGFS
jgi:hypothetical protein